MSETIDTHVHFGAPEGAGSPCYWSKQFTESPAYLAMLAVTGSLFQDVNIHLIKKKMLGVINKSKFVHKTVLLAMDQVYDLSGKARKDMTHLYTPNAFIANIAKENERVLFGASIHPYREDWKEELQFCLDHGAVLCKWIPSSMMLDPSHKKCESFFKQLADVKLPLLCHAEPEHAIPASDNDCDKFNNPAYMQKALDMGVTVIVAHCAMPLWPMVEDDSSFKELRRMLDETDQQGWNLYADVSAFCLPTRAPYIAKIRKQFPLNRLVFGSDYPIPISEVGYTAGSNWLKRARVFFKAFSTKNLLDKNYIMVKGMGLGNAMFSNPAIILRL